MAPRFLTAALGSADLGAFLEERVALRKYVTLMGTRILCLLSLLVAGGFFFFLDLFDQYSADDVFFLDSLLIAAFFVLTAGATLAFSCGLIRRQKRSVLAFRFLFVACASLSIWFRFDLRYLGDRVFLSLNEARFRSKIEAAGAAASTVVLHWASAADVYTVFVYSGSRSLPNGRMSQEAVDAFTDLEELRLCRLYSEHLRDQFYTIHIGCR